MRPSFNLLDQPWLPCVTLDGPPVTLGIREALLRSHELAELRDPSPLTTAALLRLLLAVLHAAHDRPWTNKQRAELWKAGRWDSEVIHRYLDLQQCRGRFDLFDPQFPFFQDGSFELPQPITIARLATELASGNNATLFDHTVDTSPPAVAPPGCARWVVTYQAFTLGGGQGATSARYGKHPNLRHAPAALGALVLLRGETLFQTLLLNMVPFTEREPFPGGSEDRPLWERDEFPQPAESPPPGYLAYLTWPIRCLRLRPEETIDGWAVRWVDVAQGPYFPPDGGLRDPFFAMRPSAANGYVPLRLSAERALWRDSGSLFGFSVSDTPVKGATQVEVVPKPTVLRQAGALEAQGPETALSCLVVGLDFDQAKVNLWRAEELPVPRRLLTDADCTDYLKEAVRSAGKVGHSLRDALKALARGLLKPDEPARADSDLAADISRSWGAEAQYWPALEEPFRVLLRRLAEDPDGALRQWKRAAIQSANHAFDVAEQQAGSGPRELRARVAARRFFHRLTWEWQRLLRDSEPGEEEVNNDRP